MLSMISEKKFYLWSTVLLVVIFGITLVQNVIRYQHHSSYSIWTSVVYLLFSILLFIPVIVLTVRIQKIIKKRFRSTFWLLVTGSALLTLGLFYLISNMLLHTLGYFDHFVDMEYARYYFGREALYHLLLIFVAAIYVWTKAAKKRTLDVYKGRKMIKLQVDDVEWIEAEGHYLNLNTKAQVYLKRETLSALSKKLAPDFIRIHRKYMVNKNCIQSMEKHKRDEYLVLSSGKRLKIGQSFKPIDW